MASFRRGVMAFPSICSANLLLLAIQYVGNRFRKLLKKHYCRQSMSRADDAYDNAFAESFFSRFKTELLEGRSFLNLEDARTEICEFIEMYYNRKRRHSALGYKSPLEFERLYHLHLQHY